MLFTDIIQSSVAPAVAPRGIQTRSPAALSGIVAMTHREPLTRGWSELKSAVNVKHTTDFEVLVLKKRIQNISFIIFYD